MTVQRARLMYLFDASGADVSDQVIKGITIEAADAATMSIADVRDGKKDYVVKFTIPQDDTTGSIWSTMVGQRGSIWRGYYTTAVEDLGDLGAALKAYKFDAVVSIPNGVVLGGDASEDASALLTVDIEWSLVDFDPATAAITADPIAP